MKKQIGLWIDRRKAIIVTVNGEEEGIKKIKSNMEKQVSFSGEGGEGEGARDRQFENHLNSFYDEVVAYLRDADTIQIFGPGEAKGELEKRIQNEGLKSEILPVESADKMTDNQIAAKVREHFMAQN